MSIAALPGTQAHFPIDGAFPDLDGLVGLHRYVREMRLTTAPRRGSALAGEWKSRQRGRGMDFEEVRLYQPGDDIRSIDWRVTARSQKPHTKLFSEERERPVLLAADLRSPMFFGSETCFKSVYCAALMSALAWMALAGRDRVGGIVLGDEAHHELRPKRSKHQVLEWIRQLHHFSRQLQTPCPAQQPQPLSVMLDKLIAISRPGSAIIVASDFHDFDASCVRRLHQLTRHADLTLFGLSDPLERSLPRRGGLWVSNGLERKLLRHEVDQPAQLNPGLLELTRQCAGLGIPLMSLTTTDPLLQRLYGKRRSR